LEMILSKQGYALPLVVGVDVGGTKIAAALVDADGVPLHRVRYPTEISSPQATLDSIAYSVDQVIEEAGLRRADIYAVGLGIPGLIDPERGIGIASVNLNWRNVAVRAGLQERLGLPCFIENDVKAAALGEARYGAGRGLDSLVFIIIGTGIAASVVQNHTILRGAHGIAGEIGHAVVDPDGPQCKCGGRGCFEALASGPAIAARATAKLATGGKSSLASLAEISAEDVFEAGGQGDRLAGETIQEVAGYVAFVLQFLALAYDPQVIVLGGGIPLAGDQFIDPVQKALAKQASENWVFREMYSPDLVQVTKMGADIAVIGAAALAAMPVG
jgi:glucokinase